MGLLNFTLKLGLPVKNHYPKKTYIFSKISDKFRGVGSLENFIQCFIKTYDKLELYGALS